MKRVGDLRPRGYDCLVHFIRTMLQLKHRIWDLELVADHFLKFIVVHGVPASDVEDPFQIMVQNILCTRAHLVCEGHIYVVIRICCQRLLLALCSRSSCILGQSGAHTDGIRNMISCPESLCSSIASQSLLYFP